MQARLGATSEASTPPRAAGKRQCPTRFVARRGQDNALDNVPTSWYFVKCDVLTSSGDERRCALSLAGRPWRRARLARCSQPCLQSRSHLPHTPSALGDRKRSLWTRVQRVRSDEVCSQPLRTPGHAPCGLFASARAVVSAPVRLRQIQYFCFALANCRSASRRGLPQTSKQI